MTSRILPPEEWHRLSRTELGRVTQVAEPGQIEVMVIEEAGEIVACWGLIPTLHVEGLWIDPRHKSAAVRLWRAVKARVHGRGARAVVTSACSTTVRDLLERRGATLLPGDQYLLSMEDR